MLGAPPGTPLAGLVISSLIIAKPSSLIEFPGFLLDLGVVLGFVPRLDSLVGVDVSVVSVDVAMGVIEMESSMFTTSEEFGVDVRLHIRFKI